jgi:hypothetical protein
MKYSKEIVTLIWRPRVVILGGGAEAAGGDAGATPLAAPITRRCFVGFDAAEHAID